MISYQAVDPTEQVARDGEESELVADDELTGQAAKGGDLGAATIKAKF